MAIPYKNPTTPLQFQGSLSIDPTQTFGNTFSVYNIGGYMEVGSLSDLSYTIPTGTTGTIEYSGNTIPIEFLKGGGQPYSPDVLTLYSDNISSGRRRLGMLVYVHEEDQVYQFHISGYTSLFTAATASTNCVSVSEFGTLVRNNTPQGQSFINAWTASTIEDVNGYTNETATWRKFNSGSSGSTVSGDYLPLSGGTVYGNTYFTSGLTASTLTVTGNTILANTSGTSFYTNYIDFNNTLSPLPSDVEGRMYWDEDNGTVSLGMHGGQVVQQIGLEQYYYIKNQSGATIQNGRVVRADGTLGSSGRILGKYMIANGTIPAKYTLGIATEDIIDGDDGYVTEFGLVRGINTTGSLYGETWVDGDILWVSPTIEGGLTKFEPQSPYLKIEIAIVVRAHSNGSLFVRPNRYPYMYDIQQVNYSAGTETNYDILQWSGSSWNKTNTPFFNGLTATTISATTYQNLPTDVRVTGATYSNNNFTFTNNTGGTFSVLFNTVTGLTVNGNLTVTGNTVLNRLTATTITATTYLNLPFSGTVGVTGSGGVNFLTRWSTTTDLQDSRLYDDGSFLGLGVSSPTYGEAVSLQTGNKGILIDDLYIIQTGGNSLAFTIGSDYSSWGSNSEIAIGTRGPLLNSTGSGNIGIGDKALASNTIGTNNIAIGGTAALLNNTDGTDNIAIGFNSANQNSSGTHNISLGTDSLFNNIGNRNVAIGVGAGYTNGNRDRNVYIGYGAGYSNDGSSNIFIGDAAGYGDTSSSNRLIIGDTIYGDLNTKLIGINQPTPTTTLDVNGNTNISGDLTVSTVSATTQTISGTKGSVTISGSSTTAFITVSGSNTVGGTGYTDFIRVTNTAAGATNPNKTIRVNITGGIEILNSTYLSQILTLSDGGVLSVGGGNTASVTSNDATTNYLSFNNNNTQIYDDGNTHIHSRGSGGSMWINTNGGQLNLLTQSTVNGGAIGSGIAVATTSLIGYVTINTGKTYTTAASYGYLVNSATPTGQYPGGSQSVSISLYATARIWAQEFDAFSDERMKDIQGTVELDDAIKLVNDLKPIKYTWKEGDDKGLKVGYSAQQVSKAGFDHLIGVLPKEGLEETIDEDGFVSPKDTQFSMNYEQVTPYHGVVIKHLLEEIEKLKEEIKELKNKVG